MAEKIKRGQKLLTVIYLVGQFKRKGRKLFVVCLSNKVRNLKRKAKSGLLFVYQTGPES